MCKGNYSPKIRDDLIPALYKLRKHFHIPMTKLVSDCLEKMVENYRQDGTFAIIELNEKEEAHHQELLEDLTHKVNHLIKKGKYEEARQLLGTQ